MSELVKKPVDATALLGKTVLIIEDDAFISRVYTKWLTLVGANVKVANNGALGIRILETEPVDVVLLDLGMPGLNGYDTLSELRQIPHLKELPVIVLSNTTIRDGTEMQESIHDAGVTDILRKYETSLGEIVARIKNHFPDKK